MLAVRHSFPCNYVALGAFTLAQAYSLGIVATTYSPTAVLTALVLTAACLATLTLIAHALRHRDLSFFGVALFTSGYVFLLTIIALSFVPPSATSAVVIGAAGAMLFSGYVVFDVWLMLSPHRGLPLDEYIMAAMNIYLDAVNLFVWLLQLLGSQDVS